MKSIKDVLLVIFKSNINNWIIKVLIGASVAILIPPSWNFIIIILEHLLNIEINLENASKVGWIFLSIGLITYFINKYIPSSLEILTNKPVDEYYKIGNTNGDELMHCLVYSKVLQKELFGIEEKIQKLSSESFCLFLPRDLIGGDLVFTTKTISGEIFVVGDCTGYGIPGSIIANISYYCIDRLINSNNSISPNEIIYTVDCELKRIFPTSRQGVDLGVLVIENNKKEATYCTTGIKIVKINNENIKDYRTDIRGYRINNKLKLLINETILYEIGDVFYMYSDGFADQFGGEGCKKHMFKSLIYKLKSVSNYDMETQKQLLLDEFNKWKGNISQLDDVTILGFKPK